MPSKLVKYLVVFIALVLIISLRIFENKLFYDPFLHFFKTDFQNKPLPYLEGVKLVSNLFLRYLLNTILSLIIVFFLFQNKTHVKVAAVLYFILFVILISVFAYLIFVSQEPDYFVLFYVRRFLIQPLLLLLLIPAFYFQKLTNT